MKTLAVTAVALSALGFANIAHAQQAGKLFFEGDIVRGAQTGAPGPFCVLNNQFKRQEKVVFRIRALDGTGKSLDDKGALKSVVIELSNGQKLPAYYGPHPPQGTPADFFWTAAWIVPTDYPTGTFAFKVVATDQQGQSQTWEPFKRPSSQFTVVAGQIEIKKP